MRILAIDIGGTFVKYALMRPDMSIEYRGKQPTPRSGREELVQLLCNLYEDSGADAIAISLPGIIDSVNGRCVTGGALMYNDGFCLRDALLERCKVPISIANDAKCAAMAEASEGSLKGIRNGLVLLFGTMIGGGIVIDGNVYMGSHFSAGEVSYMIPNGTKPPHFDNVWGNSCGMPALCADYAARKGTTPEQVSGEALFSALKEGEKAAVDALNCFCRNIAAQIFTLQTVLDPEIVAVGGGVSEQAEFIRAIEAELEKLYDECPFKLPRARIVPCRFRNDANLIGAVQFCLRSLGEGN